MKQSKQIITVLLFVIATTFCKPAKADMFGADVTVLVQILTNSVQQLVQLKRLLSVENNTLGVIRDINQGIKEGLAMIHILNPRFNPGIYGNLDTAEKVLRVIEDLYGKIPETSEARLQSAHDRSVSESISMNGTLFEFADQADRESRRIMDHAKVVNPKGASKLTAQSMAVLIGVTTQVLRTNSMMLKMMGEDLAIKNRHEKLESAQFKAKYDGLSKGMKDLPSNPKLQALGY